MILYHFCPAHMVDSIKKKGLVLGRMPLKWQGKQVVFINNCQSLTLQADPAKQSWATSILIPYSRTAYRLTVDIPWHSVSNLIKAKDFVRAFGIDEHLITDWAGSEDWYIYRGVIPAKWIMEIKEM